MLIKSKFIIILKIKLYELNGNSILMTNYDNSNLINGWIYRICNYH